MTPSSAGHSSSPACPTLTEGDAQRSSATPLTLTPIQRVNDRYAFFCVSEVPDSPLMWAHYAAAHTGFVVGFDSKHPAFQKLGEPHGRAREVAPSDVTFR